MEGISFSSSAEVDQGGGKEGLNGLQPSLLEVENASNAV